MLNRLMEIVYIVMNRGNVTAKELAERFEVSVRTIYRDIDALSISGIPIYMQKGKNGGIRLMDGFVLNKLLVTEEEQQQIMAGLVGLKEIGAQKETDTLQKLQNFFRQDVQEWVAVDFSDWSGRRQELFEQIKRAVLDHRVIRFDYYGQYREMSNRTVEPIQLYFKEYTWYLRGYCRERKAMRLFKIFRLKRLEVLEEIFLLEPGRHQTDVKIEAPMWEHSKDFLEIILEIDASEGYRVYDRFEEEEITTKENGNFQVRMHCIVDEWVYGVILSFGPGAKVIAPKELKDEMAERLKKMYNLYI